MNLAKVVESLSSTPDLGFNHEQAMRTSTPMTTTENGDDHE
jgi:hypothetical protein